MVESYWIYEGLAEGSTVSFLRSFRINNASWRNKNRKYRVIEAGTMGVIETNDKLLFDSIRIYTVGLQDGSSVHYVPEYIISEKQVVYHFDPLLFLQYNS